MLPDGLGCLEANALGAGIVVIGMDGEGDAGFGKGLGGAGGLGHGGPSLLRTFGPHGCRTGPFLSMRFLPADALVEQRRAAIAPVRVERIIRDDAGAFLPTYVEQGVLPADPFQTIDQEGVGQLVQLAAVRGRARRPDIKLGICGEHGGDPESIEFFHRSGLDYVSCSPFRVPVARLAAAHAALGATDRDR